MSNTTIETGITTCMTCGSVTHTDSPWNTDVVWCGQCVTRLHASRDEILRLKALQSDGNLMAGMGIRPWDRERGAQTAQRATDALAEIMAGLSIEDLRYIHELNMASA